MFRSQLFDHLQGVVLRASAITTFSACWRRFIWYVAVCCLCVCLPDVPVCGMFGSQPNKYKAKSASSYKHTRCKAPVDSHIK